MANYPIHRLSKYNNVLLDIKTSFYSEEAADKMCDLHICD